MGTKFCTQCGKPFPQPGAAQLIAQLLASASQLPAEQAGTVAVAAVTLKNEVSAASPDQGRVRQALSRLAEAAAPAAGVIELVRQLADLVAQVLH